MPWNRRCASTTSPTITTKQEGLKRYCSVARRSGYQSVYESEQVRTSIAVQSVSGWVWQWLNRRNITENQHSSAITPPKVGQKKHSLTAYVETDFVKTPIAYNTNRRRRKETLVICSKRKVVFNLRTSRNRYVPFLKCKPWVVVGDGHRIEETSEWTNKVYLLYRPRRITRNWKHFSSLSSISPVSSDTCNKCCPTCTYFIATSAL